MNWYLFFIAPIIHQITPHKGLNNKWPFVLYLTCYNSPMNQETIPSEINNVLAGESYDFAVKANRKIPLKKTFIYFEFGLIFLAVSSFAIRLLFWPIFMGQDVHFKINDLPVVAGPGHLTPLILPAIGISLFLLGGLTLIAYGFYFLYSKGAWHIGTPKRLIIYTANKTRSIDWEQFSGDIEISGTPEDGNITLLLRTGKMVSQKRGPDRYVPDVIYIARIQNAFEIEPLLRKRIKEKDTTPAKTI